MDTTNCELSAFLQIWFTPCDPVGFFETAKCLAEVCDQIRRQHALHAFGTAQKIGDKSVEINPKHCSIQAAVSLTKQRSQDSRQYIPASAFGQTRIAGSIQISLSPERNQGIMSFEYNHHRKFPG